MQKKRKSVCIISFSPVARDARVLRQIQYLSPHYDITVIGQGGQPHPEWQEMKMVRWVPVAPISLEKDLRWRFTKFTGASLLFLGKLFAASYYRWFWRQPIMKDTLAKAIASGADAFHANDWNALPIAVEAAKKLGGRVIFDDHEYAPVEFENQRTWALVYSPMIRFMLEKYAAKADVLITVAPAIAERYRQEFHLNPIVVLNTPSRIDHLPGKKVNFNDIRLIHHGGAIQARRLEVIIQALALCDRRYSLYFMLVSLTPDYPEYLKKLADELAPGRVTFLDPVAPEDVTQRISEFDMGFCYIAPTVYTYIVSLPNKFFDFIAVGLPVCIGPSPSMAEIVQSYGLGCVAASFEPEDLAATLNQLKPEQFVSMQEGARRAAQELNAEREMGKLVEVYKKLLPEEIE